ncbi:WXG100-like domain-containing protein [Streptomyces doebereineriae]|uniref:Outer membrane channel protein CpnT-like N-terminal domain-containing protein n=1 Tax=Streptomyces doebereineriae TaxID=3075528 RepID=A0ABU2VJ36_9ACTN|nr:hypothetical protein [Streptomyces sp. DSM 41640]MDT0485323.1 hypothetical protein [Streptomyces sp. DSM 41640]
MDEILDFIGINWPNVDEDDYREMADAMREFAEQFEGHGAQAHAAVSRILASSEGAAVDALQEHWDLVKSGHLEKVPDIARLFSDACDVVADIIYGMKTKAEIELGVMAASIGVSLGLAVVTGGLSAIVGAAETAAMRQLIKRIIDEAADQIVDELLARVTEPITGRLEQMVEDTVLDLTDNLIKLPPATGGAGAGEGGHGGSHTGMNLASAGGSSAGGGGGGGGRVFIDHEEYENGAGKLARHGEAMSTDSLGSLGRAKGAFGRPGPRPLHPGVRLRSARCAQRRGEGAEEGRQAPHGGRARRAARHLAHASPKRQRHLRPAQGAHEGRVEHPPGARRR